MGHKEDIFAGIQDSVCPENPGTPPRHYTLQVYARVLANGIGCGLWLSINEKQCQRAVKDVLINVVYILCCVWKVVE